MLKALSLLCRRKRRHRIVKLNYSPDLMCHDCLNRGMLRYVYIPACKAVVCYVCKDRHFEHCVVLVE